MTPWIVFHGVSSVRPPTGTGGKTIFPGSTIGHFYKKDSLLNTYIKKKPRILRVQLKEHLFLYTIQFGRPSFQTEGAMYYVHCITGQFKY